MRLIHANPDNFKIYSFRLVNRETYEIALESSRGRSMDRETEFTVRTPLIDSDFGKSVRILIPEGRPRRPIAEGPRALQHSTRRGKSCVGRQHGAALSPVMALPK
jgi:hypothetical protein